MSEVTKQNLEDQDLYESKRAAEMRAQQIGCVGVHVHEVDGKVLYMPCEEMSEYERLTGLAHTSDEDLSLIEKQPRLSRAVQEGLRNKVEAHNKKYGNNPKRRATYRMLAASFRRGVGAYRTNPQSVRPDVKSPDQWAYARVNAFLRALGTDKYQSGRFDTDLLPKGHKFSTKKSMDEQERIDQSGDDTYHHDMMNKDDRSDKEMIDNDTYHHEPMIKAVWSASYRNALPDSAFFYIGPGGEKDEDGKTEPRALRKLPYRNHTGNIDLPHLRAALSRLSQTDIPASARDEIRSTARRLLAEETRKALISKAYEDIDFDPPKGVAEEAAQGLKYRREGNPGGTLIGVSRARDLKNRKRVSPDTIRRMVSFFARHEVDLDVPHNRDRSHPNYPGPGRVAWLLWGGDSGRRWAEKIRDQMRREDNVEKSELMSAINAHLHADDTFCTHLSEIGIETNTESIVTAISKDADILVVRRGQVLNGCEWVTSSMDFDIPEGAVLQVATSKDGTGEYNAMDVLFYNGTSTQSLSYSERLDLLAEIFDTVQPNNASVVKAWPGESTEELTLACRSAAYAANSGRLIIRDASTEQDFEPSTHLEILGGYNDGNFGQLMDYMPVMKGNNTKALFVTGSPNSLERARSAPLAGPDGATFNDLYLNRMGIKRSEVTIMYANPVYKSDTKTFDGDWQKWLHKQVSLHPGIPVIALGKVASACLLDIPHTTLPHPRAVRRKGDRGEIARKANALRKQIEKSNATRFCPILKADEEKRIVYGIVLEPHTVDLQGDVLGVDTIEEAAHKYLTASRTVGDGHSHKADAEVVESYLAPADYKLGGQDISKGTWVMGVRILDSALWQMVKNGEYTGFSIGGTGTRHAIE